MSHPLTPSEMLTWRNPKGQAVIIPVERIHGESLRVVADRPSGIMRIDAKFSELPKRLHVVSASGAIVEPSDGSRLYISIETTDPYHLITELPVEIIV